MRKLISLLLSAVLSPVAVLAQSPGVQGDATKSVQPSQSVAVVYSAAQPEHDGVKLRAGMPIDVESAYTVSSLDLRPNDYLTFRVLIPIKVDGIIAIEKDALVTGRVIEARRGRHWGKAGKLQWTIVDVVAIDGTRVPLQVSKDLPNGRDGIKGTSHGAEVATRTVVLGALMAPLFPIAPLALMSGFRRGEDAILPQGKRFVVFVQADTTIKATTNR